MKIILVRIKHRCFLSMVYHASIARQCVMLVTPTFLAGAVSITVSLQHAPAYIHSTRRRGRSRRYYYRYTSVPPRRRPARNKKTAAPRGLVHVVSLCELKDRTVINNRFLPASVCAAPRRDPPKARFFFSSRIARSGRGGDEVDDGENVGHKNVPVRNGPSEKETRRKKEREREFGR